MDQALLDFDRAREAFEEALRGAPDASLRYRPAGEDYALGGLVIHVAEVLEKYAGVLGRIRDASFGPLQEEDHPTSAADAALIREGFGAEGRTTALERVRAAHGGLVDQVRAVGATDFERKAPVTYQGATEPYPTSAADVLGWVRDHYDEHVQQIGQLVSDWSEATR
jgi:hypothetical protein